MKKRNQKENIKRYILLSSIALILSIVFEFVLVESNTFSEFSLGNVLAIFGIVVFIGMHFVFGFKKLYNYIIDNRYKISIVLIIASTIIGFMQNNIGIREWIFSSNIQLCLWWNIKFFALILASFELMQIITNNRNISLIASIIISLSGAIQWNFEYINSIILGQIIIVLLYNLINTEKKKIKIINTLSIIVLFGVYVQTTISFAIVFIYIWIALAIWILIKNKERLRKDTLKFVIITFICSVISSFVSFKFIKLGLQYDPTENNKGYSYLFTYIYNILLPFTNMEEKYIFGNFISLFPIPMLVALYYLYKNEKHSEFLLPVTIVAVLETIYCISGFPNIISKILGFDNTSVVRCSVAVNYINLILVFYMISNIDKIFNLNTAMKLTIVSVCILAFIGYPGEFSERKYLYLFAAEVCTLFLLFYNFGNKKYQKVLLFFMLLLTLISGIFVNPIIKDKATIVTAQKVQQIER